MTDKFQGLDSIIREGYANPPKWDGSDYEISISMLPGSLATVMVYRLNQVFFGTDLLPDTDDEAAMQERNRYVDSLGIDWSELYNNEAVVDDRE